MEYNLCSSRECNIVGLGITSTHQNIRCGRSRWLVMDDQLSLLLRREGLGQDCWCIWFRCSLKKLSDLGTSWTILHVVIITTYKARVSWFVLIPIFNRGIFRLLCLIIIFSLLILASPFLGFIFTGRGRLNNIHLRSFTSGSGRRQSILNIRRSRLRIGA
jgi:hypothetical protein